MRYPLITFSITKPYGKAIFISEDEKYESPADESAGDSSYLILEKLPFISFLVNKGVLHQYPTVLIATKNFAEARCPRTSAASH
ncbi:MAG: hypothetical protein B6245_11645 [Desulfobacteraceae bacterium 4572_88]|nr:MAG: hypothetical protein B6245_11645 [Desulfobacteraceae bacterium 4572_88]RLC19963.1 MAG: hypothetical protein DRI57_05915 [Deltaproteobacteria bacterium]